MSEYNQIIVKKVCDTLLKAASAFTQDQKRAYERALGFENNEKACWVLKTIMENADIAEDRVSPLCDDTGIPHLFLEIGCGRSISGQMIESIYEGVRQGLRILPGRPMAIMGSDIERIDQSGGLNDDSGAVIPAPMLLKYVDDDILRLHVLMLGGGPAIRGITHRIFHKHSIDVVLDEIVSRATEGVRMLGCTPCVLAVGIGRSQF